MGCLQEYGTKRSWRKDGPPLTTPGDALYLVLLDEHCVSQALARSNIEFRQILFPIVLNKGSNG